jgi:hypothetical protein
MGNEVLVMQWLLLLFMSLRYSARKYDLYIHMHCIFLAASNYVVSNVD